MLWHLPGIQVKIGIDYYHISNRYKKRHKNIKKSGNIVVIVILNLITLTHCMITILLLC